MRARTQSTDLILLIVSLLGPLLHVVGLATRGVALLYIDYSRLAFMYGFLALSGAAAAVLITRQGSQFRWVALVALLFNLGSLVYAGVLWRNDAARRHMEAELMPFAAGQVGIVIAPSSERPNAIAEARAVEDTIHALLQQANLSNVGIQRTSPIASEAQALRLGQRLRANVVVWATERGSDAIQIDRYVTVLGASGPSIQLNPLNMMLVMATQCTFSVRSTHTPDETAISSVATGIVAPVAAGFGALALGEPVAATSDFYAVLSTPNVTTDTLCTVYNYMGTALLFAQRADLAVEQFEQSQALAPDASSWVGMGMIYLTRNDYVRAAAAFDNATDLDPYNALAYCGAGIVRAQYYEVGRALAAFQQAVALEPDWSASYALLGLGYEWQADSEAAHNAYQTCALKANTLPALRAAVEQRMSELASSMPTALPTATPLPTPTATPLPEEGVYRVQSGDTLETIADKLGISMDELIDINNIDDPNSLVVGQILIVPGD